MCGIVGEISFRSLVNTSWVDNAISSLKHRGPDSHGKWLSENKKVLFGHTRLSILDLTDNGHQPMISNCQNYVITFNGEIYNFKELEKKILEKGIKLKTKSDTEILLNCYKIWNLGCLNMLEGMFAFSIYDKKNNIVIFARDKSGQKPLYLSKNNISLSFSSELKGLLKNSNIKRKLSQESFAEYLHQGYVSGKKSLLKDVFKLKAGQYLIYNLSKGDIIYKNFFELPLKSKSNNISKDTNNLFEKFNSLLGNSVKDQIHADVPVGILLSGGLDSSIITALASNNSKKINTFTFINDINNEDDFELKNSRNVSNFFSTNHTEIYYPKVSAKIIDEIATFIDDPIMDSSIIPTYLITKEIKRHCTVALGGDGGDELFGGYDHYSRLISLAKIKNLLPKNLSKLISNLSNLYLPIGFRGRNWLNLLSKNLSKDFLDFAIYFDKSTYSKMINKNFISFFKNLQVPERTSIINDDLIYKSCAQDFNNFLIEDILVKTDRSSMANSLELRCPFLDSNIINFAFGDVHSSLKANNINKKIFLKKFASNILPKNFELNKKRGFSIPINKYFEKKDWKDMAKNILLDEQSLFNTKFVSNLIDKSFFNHNNSERIFGLIMFELWRKKYDISII
ncbi:asparagine synthase (glutamine-hydrolyzing) [Candidatus Pelagibacter ubique]|nr:asparagine synthase (glutamine-hydrolyzing) [Candidatus Pelagibacter ubique]